ncbi:hypothetical protein CkaCkLH20_07651 [Colletotrichum karsti]|uniref:Uncharacterized protein n=1 Tax=Colletotrichum karsti TaxID=1095194 RepID=A0A9P6I387_9PEZI|nr:uncharacterized protein CkaCkLH20_07651 [Colletotrichum karsti]KAF9874957.1 hypothetical protein CkaCkLH20_07651 [Colletotrichum karsti]
MKASSILFFTTLVSSGLALSIDTSILKSLHLRAAEDAQPAVAPEDILNPVVKARECEEPAEPEEPSEAERKNGAKRPSRPSRPSNC